MGQLERHRISTRSSDIKRNGTKVERHCCTARWSKTAWCSILLLAQRERFPSWSINHNKRRRTTQTDVLQHTNHPLLHCESWEIVVIQTHFVAAFDCVFCHISSLHQSLTSPCVHAWNWALSFHWLPSAVTAPLSPEKQVRTSVPIGDKHGYADKHGYGDVWKCFPNQEDSPGQLWVAPERNKRGREWVAGSTQVRV